jgi:hypothetical protein
MHVEHTGRFILPVPLRDALPFFSPEGERAWVPGWEPEYLHPLQPSNEVGTVFRTQHHGEETLWLVLQYDPGAGLAAYGRFTPESRIGTVHVRCEEVDPSRTQVTVTYALTALSAHGTGILAALTADRYAEMLNEWGEAIVRSQSARSGPSE